MIGRSQQLIRVDFENQPDHEVLASMLGDFERGAAGARRGAVLRLRQGRADAHPADDRAGPRAGKPVLVDPKGSDYSRYAGATVITPNRAELAQVVGPWASEADLHERAHACASALGSGRLLLTRSEEGMSLFDEADGAPATSMCRHRRARCST